MHELEGAATSRRGESNTSINSFIYSPNQFIMKKKVFSLMMTLLLAFVGVAKAETIEIGDGTATQFYAPFNSFFKDTAATEIYTRVLSLQSEQSDPAAVLHGMDHGIEGCTCA